MKNARLERPGVVSYISLLKRLFAWVDDVVTTVVSAGCVIGAAGFFFTVADGFHLTFFHALYFQGGDQSLRAFLTQGQIVFCAAAIIGVAFDFDGDVRVSSQELGVVSYQSIEFWLDGVLVEVEVDATVFVDRAVWIQVRWQWSSNWCWYWSGDWCCWSWCWSRGWRRCWSRSWCRGRASAQQSDGAGCQQNIGFSFHRNTPDLILLEGHMVMVCEAVTQPATSII